MRTHDALRRERLKRGAVARAQSRVAAACFPGAQSHHRIAFDQHMVRREFGDLPARKANDQIAPAPTKAPRRQLRQRAAYRVVDYLNPIWAGRCADGVEQVGLIV